MLQLGVKIYRFAVDIAPTWKMRLWTEITDVRVIGGASSKGSRSFHDLNGDREGSGVRPLHFDNSEKEYCAEDGDDAVQKEESPLEVVAEVVAAAADAEEVGCVCLEINDLEEGFQISTLRLDSESRQRDPV